MKLSRDLTRRAFLASTGAAVPVFAGLATPSTPQLGDLRRAIVDSPVGVGLHRARTYTRVFQATEGRPWIVRKGLALREYFETVPLYLRPGDCIAGSISETPGAMPLMVEIGIGENDIYTGENPERKGYLKGKVPQDIWEYWLPRNLYGRHQASTKQPLASRPHAGAAYKMISCQGHLSPSYSELLRTGLGGMLAKVRARQAGEADPEKRAFLESAGYSLAGVSAWAAGMGRSCPAAMRNWHACARRWPRSRLRLSARRSS